MICYPAFQDGPEYDARRRRNFVPPNISIKDIRAAVPKHLFQRSTLKSLLYLFRHLAFTYAFYYIAAHIDTIAQRLVPGNSDSMSQISYGLTRGSLWILYWGWQGVAFAGIWCLGMPRLIYKTMRLSLKSILPGHEVSSCLVQMKQIHIENRLVMKRSQSTLGSMR